MKAVCYISRFATNINKIDINALIKSVIINNKKNNITGVLIIKNKHFFQILEGEDDQINQLYELIYKDNRHENMIKLLDEKLKDRLFVDYNCGEFQVFQKHTDLSKLLTYYKWIKSANYLPANQLIQLTKKFISHN